MDVRGVAEEAEVDREEDGKVPPCGDGLGGEVAREVHRRAAGVEKARREEGGRWGPRPWGESRGESRGRGLEIG